MSDEPTIPPALTPEEWEEFRRDGMWVDNWFGPESEGIPPRPADAHRAAAVALYGQPFGFTQEDVALLRKVRECYDRSGEEDGGWVDTWFTREEGERFVSLAARLAALLPAP